MEKQFNQKGIAEFAGLNIAKNNLVTLKFKLRYDEIVTSVELLQGLNTDITIHAKTPSTDSVKLGMFTIGGMNIDRDGNATIPFKALADNVNLNSICDILDEDYIQLKFMAVLELPDGEADSDEDDDEDWDD